MAKNDIFETQYERFLRERAEKIQQEYLGRSHEILSGQLSPNRVIQYLANHFGMTGEGVKSILKRKGVYKSAKQPIILPKCEPKQLSMAFVADSVQASRL